jgi:hypothetical protein
MTGKKFLKMLKFLWRETEIDVFILVGGLITAWCFLNTKMAEKYPLIYLIAVGIWILILIILFYILISKKFQKEERNEN